MAQAAITDKCDLCETEERVNFFCVDCDAILCFNCKVLHSKIKKTRNDQVIPLSQARDQSIVHKSTTIYCSEHSTVDVTLFCLKCDQLICTLCLAQKHKGHGITTPDEIRHAKAEELNKLIKRLKEKKVICENAFEIEGQVHSQFTKSIDQVRKEIVYQRAKIIDELDNVCYQQNAELTALQETENKRYSDACMKIQVQNQAVTSALQATKNSVDSDNSTRIIKTTMATAHTLQGLEDLTMPQATTVTYQPGDRSRPTIHHVQGEINITKGAKPEPMSDVQEHKKTGVNKPRSNKNQFKVKSTIKLEYKGEISVILPLTDKTAWVKSYMDEKCLLLIDSTGKIVSKSVSLDKNIRDAKLYRNGLLVTCRCHSTIYSLSADGKSSSTFSDLTSYNTRGLCVTQDNDVMVCLRSRRDIEDNKVVRINTEGNIIQTLQYDVTGAPLYNNPRRVISLTTGEVIVKDGDSRIIGVDRKGQHLFTWEGEIQGRKTDRYSITSITRDSNNRLFVTDDYNNRVYELDKNGSAAMCVIDSTQSVEFFGPQSIAVDNVGQMWVGCKLWKIHIIEY